MKVSKSECPKSILYTTYKWQLNYSFEEQKLPTYRSFSKILDFIARGLLPYHILILGASTEDGQVVKQLFSSVGLCEQVPESQQDAFTGMAGSGPAYIYTIIEALSDGGVRMGLPRNLATTFAAQMTLGNFLWN